MTHLLIHYFLPMLSMGPRLLFLPGGTVGEPHVAELPLHEHEHEHDDGDRWRVPAGWPGGPTSSERGDRALYAGSPPRAFESELRV